MSSATALRTVGHLDSDRHVSDPQIRRACLGHVPSQHGHVPSQHGRCPVAIDDTWQLTPRILASTRRRPKHRAGPAFWRPVNGATDPGDSRSAHATTSSTRVRAAQHRPGPISASSRRDHPRWRRPGTLLPASGPVRRPAFSQHIRLALFDEPGSSQWQPPRRPEHQRTGGLCTAVRYRRSLALQRLHQPRFLVLLPVTSLLAGRRSPATDAPNLRRLHPRRGRRRTQ